MRKGLLLFLACLLIPGSTSAWALAVKQQAKLLPADGSPLMQFGTHVVIDGDTALVGVPNDDLLGFNSGSVYVFVRAQDTWTEQDKLSPSDGSTQQWFGDAIALDGNTAIIGAWGDAEIAPESGAAYVFTRSGEVWTERAKLLAADAQSGDRFGSAVALDGGTAIVGAQLDDSGGLDGGSVYIFTGAGDTWTERTKLLTTDGAAFDWFGHSVALSDGVAVIGAYGDNDNGADSGSAYVFTGNGDNWIQRTKLLASDGAAGDWFGWRVALDGNTALVGAPLDDLNGSSSGSAYAFKGSGGSWSQQAKLLPDEGAAEDFFGWQVALDGDTAAVGAWGDDDNGPESGAAYVFLRTGNVWNQQVRLLPDDGAPGDSFGRSVDVDGDTAVVGANGDDDDGTSSGSAYVSLLDQCGISVETEGADTLIRFSPESSAFSIVSGWVSELTGDGDYSGAECLGSLLTNPVTDTLPSPSPGEVRYYLARGLSVCRAAGYGFSSLDPDPRDELLSGPCR